MYENDSTMQREAQFQIQAENIMSKYPSISYHKHPTQPGKVVAVRPFESGYYPIETSATPEALNKTAGVTPEQAEAMLAGSMFGWDCPGADPRYYTAHAAL